MFCSSLRKRKDWASAPNALLRGQWKEAKLDTHDAAFAIPSRGEAECIFRLLLLSTADKSQGNARERIERLSVLNGGAHMAIVLLLVGDDAMASFAQLQVETLHSGIEVPIIPIIAASDIKSCLDNLRKQYSESHSRSSSAQNTASQRDLLSHCTVGQPLSERQTNMVLDVSSGFKDLSGHAFDPDSQQLLCSLIENGDAARLMAFLKEGPLPARD